MELCRKAHYQPLLLVYSDPFADKIAMTTTPVQVTRVVATETKTKSLTPVTEEASEISADTRKTSDNKPLTNSGPYSMTGGSQSSSVRSQLSNGTYYRTLARPARVRKYTAENGGGQRYADPLRTVFFSSVFSL